MTIAGHGRPAHEILRQLEEGDHDLVVMGSRGRGRLASNLLGSVGGDVHFHAHVPMLVVHPDEAQAPGSEPTRPDGERPEGS